MHGIIDLWSSSRGGGMTCSEKVSSFERFKKFEGVLIERGGTENVSKTERN
jgi:hypothetical protein